MNGEFTRAVEALRAGKPVVFPTDTVYGLGVSVRHAPSLQAIYDIKRRDAGKPVAWLVGSAAAPVPGWYFRYGSTGVCPVGDGRWYFSENARDGQTGRQISEARLYRWTGFQGTTVPFLPEP